MRIVAVCGSGIGTSAILAATARRALARLDVEADVVASSIAALASDAADAQVVLVTPEWIDRAREAAGYADVVLVERIADLDALEAILADAL